METGLDGKVIERIRMHPSIQFIFLTKGGYDAYAGYNFPDNVVCGITATKREDLPSKTAGRFSPAKHWLINLEPILGSFYGAFCEDIINEFNWIILGAETGNRREKIVPSIEWFEWMLNQTDIPVFVKSSLEVFITKSTLIKKELI